MKTSTLENEISSFCRRHNITEDQFFGREKISGYLDLRGLTSIPAGFNPTVGGYLDLRGLTSIPAGFNPTVGGYLDLSGLTSIPAGFNPTVGGYLYWRNGSKHIGATVNVEVEIPNIDIELTWKDGKYSKIDGIFCEIVSAHAWTIDYEPVTIFRAKKVNKGDFFFIAKNGRFYAHGKSIESAVADLKFKIVADKLKKEPITKDTEITVMYYRTLTGACDLGCRDFMERHSIPFKVEDGRTVEVAPMKAIDLLPILEKSNAYGIAAFKKLVEF